MADLVFIGCNHHRQPGLPCATPGCSQGHRLEFYAQHIQEGPPLTWGQSMEIGVETEAPAIRTVYWRRMEQRLPLRSTELSAWIWVSQEPPECTLPIVRRR